MDALNVIDAMGEHLLTCKECSVDNASVLDDTLCRVGELLAKRTVLAIADAHAERERDSVPLLEPGEYDSDDLDRIAAEQHRSAGVQDTTLCCCTEHGIPIAPCCSVHSGEIA